MLAEKSPIDRGLRHHVCYMVSLPQVFTPLNIVYMYYVQNATSCDLISSWLRLIVARACRQCCAATFAWCEQKTLQMCPLLNNVNSSMVRTENDWCKNYGDGGSTEAE